MEADGHQLLQKARGLLQGSGVVSADTRGLPQEHRVSAVSGGLNCITVAHINGERDARVDLF